MFRPHSENIEQDFLPPVPQRTVHRVTNNPNVAVNVTLRRVDPVQGWTQRPPHVRHVERQARQLARPPLNPLLDQQQVLVQIEGNAEPSCPCSCVLHHRPCWMTDAVSLLVTAIRLRVGLPPLSLPESPFLPL